MQPSSTLVGIDIGSVSVAVVKATTNGDILHSAYPMYGGRISETLNLALQELALARIAGVATTPSMPPLLKSSAQYDPRVAVIRAARHFFPTIGALLWVGARNLD